jgi:hypothetical protein
MRSKYLVLGLILFAIAGANAMNNFSEVVGPYKISFSLPDDLNVTVNKTTENKESFYGDEYTNYILNLRASLNPAHTAIIGVMENGEEDLIYHGRSFLETMEGLGYINVTPVYWEIDARPGILVVGSSTLELPQIHGFVYLFDNQTPVVVSSTFPWDNGTSMMLTTIHVEKVN